MILIISIKETILEVQKKVIKKRNNSLVQQFKTQILFFKALMETIQKTQKKKSRYQDIFHETLPADRKNKVFLFHNFIFTS